MIARAKKMNTFKTPECSERDIDQKNASSCQYYNKGKAENTTSSVPTTTPRSIARASSDMCLRLLRSSLRMSATSQSKPATASHLGSSSCGLTNDRKTRSARTTRSSVTVDSWPTSAAAIQTPALLMMGVNASAASGIFNPALMETLTDLSLSSPIPEHNLIPSNFTQNSFATSSLARPMCRICHGCSGFVEPSRQLHYSGTPSINTSGTNRRHPRRLSETSLSTMSMNTNCQEDADSTITGSSRKLGHLIAPCLCDGSLKYVHEVCVQQWITVSHSHKCELCHFPFRVKTFMKPLCQWKPLPLSTMESRRLICSVTFHLLAIICVVWSLFVLLERVVEEVQEQLMGWPFWTKLIVIAIGLVGGLIYTYVQWRLYIDLLMRLRDYNRVFVVQMPTDDDLKKARLQQRVPLATTNTSQSLHGSRMVQEEESLQQQQHSSSTAVGNVATPNENVSMTLVTSVP